MKLRVRYAADVRDRAHEGRFVSSVELSGQGASLADLKTAILGCSDTRGVTLALGSSLLVPVEGQADEDTSLKSLGVVQHDIVWVKSLPSASGGVVRMDCEGEEATVNCCRLAENLPESVRNAKGNASDIVRLIVGVAMESIGFDRIDPVDGTVQRYSFVVGDNHDSIDLSLSTSVMLSSCMLVGEVFRDGAVSEVTRLLRFEEDMDTQLDNRLSLLNRVLDGFCVPLMRDCCHRLGVEYPLETLASLPREVIEMIVERLPGCEAPRCLGLVCKRLAAIVFDPNGLLYSRTREMRAQSIKPVTYRRQMPPSGRRSYPGHPWNPIGGSMDHHIIGGAYDMMPGGFVGLPPRGPTRSSQQWRL